MTGGSPITSRVFCLKAPSLFQSFPDGSVKRTIWGVRLRANSYSCHHVSKRSLHPTIPTFPEQRFPHPTPFNTLSSFVFFCFLHLLSNQPLLCQGEAGPQGRGDPLQRGGGLDGRGRPRAHLHLPRVPAVGTQRRCRLNTPVGSPYGDPSVGP